MYISICILSLDDSTKMHSLTSDTKGQSKEYKIFIQHYKKLTDLLPISSITPQLVSAEVITIAEEEQILSGPRQKASVLLSKISKSLESGYVKSFYSLLTIMRESGGDISTLACDIATDLAAGM